MPYDPRKMPMVRTAAVKKERRRPFAAFDFETTQIPKARGDVLRVEPVYLTAYADAYGINTPMDVAFSVFGHIELADILRRKFFTKMRDGTRYIAWNANRFDYAPIVESLVSHMPDYVAHPYLAGDSSTNKYFLRGIRIEHKDNGCSWEIADGIAMTGCVGWSLRKFLELFSPDHQKHVLDLGSTAFDASDPDHIAYAKADSRGLYEAMTRVDTILRDLTQRGAQLTIGNAGVKFFMSQLPEGVKVWNPPKALLSALRSYGVRGGFALTKTQYYGPLWKYDRNSQYASILRAKMLPCGNVYTVREEVPDRIGLYFCTIFFAGGAPVPFYCAEIEGTFSARRYVLGDKLVHTCLLSCEITTLRDLGWSVEVEHGWFWEDAFTLQEMVNRLERLRGSASGGWDGAIGKMIKNIGNHATGKTAEKPKNERLVLSKENPSTEDIEYVAWRPGHVTVSLPAGAALEDEQWNCYWSYEDDEDKSAKVYHRPQIHALVSAYSRCDVYALAMRNPQEFIMADTDCIAFSAPQAFVEEQIHATRYGAMHHESNGDIHIVIGVKVYYNVTRQKGVCKVLDASTLTQEMYEAWYSKGVNPTQTRFPKRGIMRGIGPQTPQYACREMRGADYRTVAPSTIPSFLAPSEPVDDIPCG